MQITIYDTQKLCFLVHFSLSIAALSSNLLGDAYLVCQGFMIGLSLWWYMDETQAKPLQMLAKLAFLTLILDPVIVGFRYSKLRYEMSHNYRFSLAMAIILMLLKVPMFFFTLKNARRLDVDSNSGQQQLLQIPTPNINILPQALRQTGQNQGGYQQI